MKRGGAQNRDEELQSIRMVGQGVQRKQKKVRAEAVRRRNLNAWKIAGVQRRKRYTNWRFYGNISAGLQENGTGSRG